MAKVSGKAASGAAAITLAAGLVCHFEGYSPTGYADPIGIPTVCYGHTDPSVRVGAKYSRPECEALLAGDLAKASAAVRHCIHTLQTDGQEGSLTSATVNIGPKIVCGSTLQRLANAGDWKGACAQLDRWVYAHGIKFNGLVRRRHAERTMCEGRA